MRERRAKNRERYNAKAREWKLRNAERNRAITRAWHEANPHANAMHAHRRRARVLEVGGSFTAKDVEAQFNAQDGRCFYCGIQLTRFHVDHRMPIARGGSNGPENIACACPPCNLSKSTKTEAEFRAVRALVGEAERAQAMPLRRAR